MTTVSGTTATQEPTRVDRTRRDIKAALMTLLKDKTLDAISMSEIAREAHISRSTLYQHYNNAREIYDDIIGEFKLQVSPIMTSMACFEGISEPGTRPFCELLRKPERYQSVIASPCFLDTYVNRLQGNNEFLDVLSKAGYSEEVAHALAVFQMNGCFRAAREFGSNDARWKEIREAIDAFVCGGLAECVARKEADRKRTM